MIKYGMNARLFMTAVAVHFAMAPLDAVANDSVTKVTPITIPQARIAPDLIPKVEKTQ